MVKILRENNEMKQISLECIKGAIILDEEEIKRLPKEKRMCRVSQTERGRELYIASNGFGGYWLCTPGVCRDMAKFVDNRGEVSYELVDTGGIGIRPALVLNSQCSDFSPGDSFEFDGCTFEVISNDLALCDVIIEACPFNESQRDGNNYETSYVKKKVEDWFRDSRKDLECREYGVETDDEIFNGLEDEWINW